MGVLIAQSQRLIEAYVLPCMLVMVRNIGAIAGSFFETHRCQNNHACFDAG